MPRYSTMPRSPLHIFFGMILLQPSHNSKSQLDSQFISKLGKFVKLTAPQQLHYRHCLEDGKSIIYLFFEHRLF